MSSSEESEFVLKLLQNRGKYAGKWIAVLDSEVIAAGDRLEAVYRDATKVADGRTPLFERIPLRQEENETLIL